MAVPSQTEMFHHVFDFFATTPGEFRRSEVKERVSNILGLNTEEKNYRTSSGVPVYQSRIGWAIFHINDAGLIDRISRGVYRINDKGKEIYAEKLGIEEFALYLRENRAGGETTTSSSPKEVELSPIEIVDKSVADINKQVGRELLDRIYSKDPQFFEQLTVDLIEKMGYGKGEPTSYIADGGIDGIIATDSLGFDPIFIQAKRYEINSTIGRPEIQKFAGAMNEITRGVFITTAKYSKEAIAYAESYKHGTIKLVDGEELVDLMMKFNLGATNERSFNIKRLDVDYFEEE